MGWRDVIFKTDNSMQRVQTPSVREAFVPSVPFVCTNEKLKTVSDKKPAWCSSSCTSLMVIHTPQGKLAGCRQEFDDQIAWVRLSFLSGCPMKIGRIAMNDEGWPKW